MLWASLLLFEEMPNRNKHSNHSTLPILPPHSTPLFTEPPYSSLTYPTLPRRTEKKIRPKRPIKLGRNDPGTKQLTAKMTRGRNDLGPKQPGSYNIRDVSNAQTLTDICQKIGLAIKKALPDQQNLWQTLSREASFTGNLNARNWVCSVPFGVYFGPHSQCKNFESIRFLKNYSQLMEKNSQFGNSEK